MGLAHGVPGEKIAKGRVVANSIVRYMMLDGDVWVYLDDHDVRQATGQEIARIIDSDPEFALHFSAQNANGVPKLRDREVSLKGLKLPN